MLVSWIMAAMVIAHFYAIVHVEVAYMIAVKRTSLLFGMLYGAWLFHESGLRKHLAAGVLMVLGVFLILRPGLAVISPASLAVLGSAFCYALSHTLTRKLALVDTPLTILFYMTVIQLPLGFVTSIFDWTTPSFEMLPWIIVVGAAALSGHYCMARALAIADAIVVVPLDFLRLPLIAAVGFLFYGESLDGFVLAGGVVMFAGNFLNIRAEKKRNLKKG